MTAVANLERTRHHVANAEWLNVLARIGLAAIGVSSLLIGILAFRLAVEGGQKSANPQGALEHLVQPTFGKLLLVLLGLGFVAHAIWRFAQTFFDKTNVGDGRKGMASRAGYFGIGLVYTALAYSTFRIVAGSGQQNGDQKAHKTTATVLSWPAGTWLVGAAGIALVVVGLAMGYRGLGRRFEKNWETQRMGDTEQTWGSRAGVVGLLARMVVFALIGVFLVKAAIEYDPREAVGLDGALQRLAAHSYGSWLIGVVAAGFVAYAVYSYFEARYRRV